jgi:hypothetical protein
MAKFRVSYAKGEAAGRQLGEYDHLSEVHTVLDHSDPKWRERLADKRDDHNFTINDKNGQPAFVVTGPKADKPTDDDTADVGK